MIYENRKDREQQSIACFQLARHLTALGITNVSVSETPEHRRECYDAEMHVHGMWTGVVEVKTRDIDSDTLEQWGSVVIETERCKSLSKMFYKTSDISKKRFWNKEVIFLWRLKKDDTAYAINLRRVRELWRDLEDAPPEAMKDDHGNILADKRGKLIPITSLERVE